MSFHPVTKDELAQCLFDYVAKRDGKEKTIHLCALYSPGERHPLDGFFLELGKMPGDEECCLVELKDTNATKGGNS